jgi:hypothetical protein
VKVHTVPQSRAAAIRPDQNKTGLAASFGLSRGWATTPVCDPVAGQGLERIPSPLTLSSDLGKRRSAQRLALDTWVENDPAATANSQVTDTVDAAFAPSAEQWTA